MVLRDHVGVLTYCMIQALEVGVNKVHLIDGRLQHSLLLELFTDKGVGTEIVKEATVN